VGEILLIAADWQFRVLVRAQLLEEGFEVSALPALESGLAYLARSGEQPQLTILDSQDVRIVAGALQELWRLTGEAPLLLCGHAPDQATLSQEGMPPARLLLRPFRVGDVVQEVRRMLACLQSDVRAE
jgi:DNA-binding response OmpR family regulator